MRPPTLLSTLPLFLVVAACDATTSSLSGDISDAASSAGDSSPTPDGGDTSEPDLTYVDDSPIALDLLNAQRLASNLDVLTLDAEMSAGCAAHVAYMKAAGRLVREEDPAAAEYSEAGAAAAKSALLASRMERASDAAVAWTASVYHRVVWLEPGVTRVGFAYADGYACLDVLTAWAPVERFVPVLYPGLEQVEVPTSFAPAVGISPLPASLEPPTGVLVSVLFPPEVQLGVDFTASLTRVSCAGECASDAAPEAVEVLLKLPLDADDPYTEYQRNAVVLVPTAPLEAGARYEVQLTGLVDAVESTRIWQFATRAAAAP